MKNRVLTVVGVMFAAVPLFSFPVINSAWLIGSRFYGMAVSSYAVVMIFGGVFTALAYFKYGGRNNLMSVLIWLNGILAVLGVSILVPFMGGGF